MKFRGSREASFILVTLDSFGINDSYINVYALCVRERERMKDVLAGVAGMLGPPRLATLGI